MTEFTDEQGNVWLQIAIIPITEWNAVIERIETLESELKRLNEWAADEFDYEPWMTQSRTGLWGAIKAFITGDWR